MRKSVIDFCCCNYRRRCWGWSLILSRPRQEKKMKGKLWVTLPPPLLQHLFHLGFTTLLLLLLFDKDYLLSRWIGLQNHCSQFWNGELKIPTLKQRPSKWSVLQKTKNFRYFLELSSALMPLSGIDQFRMEIESLDLVIVF